jgi:hypothetical protein
LQSSDGWIEVSEEQTLVVAAGETFSIDFVRRFVRVWSFTNSLGIEDSIRKAGESYDKFFIPENPVPFSCSRTHSVSKDLNISYKDL